MQLMCDKARWDLVLIPLAIPDLLRASRPSATHLDAVALKVLLLSSGELAASQPGEALREESLFEAEQCTVNLLPRGKL